MPVSKLGARYPKFVGEVCCGKDLSGLDSSHFIGTGRLNLQWLIDAYNIASFKESFFIDYFDKLSGTDQLRIQIKSGLDEYAIRKTWQTDLDTFMLIRSKYLLYPDFK